jgi:PKD repeat protein
MKQFCIVLMAGTFFFISCRPDNPTPPPPAPNAAFSYTSLRAFPVQVQFTNLSTSPFPGVSTFAWDFGDGNGSALSTNPVHTYTQPGTYQIKLIQTYSNSTKDTVVKNLLLSINGPGGTSTLVNGITTTDFTFSFPTGFTVTFINTSTNAASYLWDFGDGTNSAAAGTTVTHNYNGAGPFNIILKATGEGGSDTCSAKIAF